MINDASNVGVIVGDNVDVAVGLVVVFGFWVVVGRCVAEGETTGVTVLAGREDGIDVDGAAVAAGLEMDKSLGVGLSMGGAEQAERITVSKQKRK